MECNCGAFVPAGMRNCPICGRLVNSDGVNPSSMGSRVFEPRKLRSSRTAPDPVGMSSGGGASGGSEYFRKTDEYVLPELTSSKSGKSTKKRVQQPRAILRPSAPKPPPELTIRHSLVASTASVRSARDIPINTVLKAYVVLRGLSAESVRTSGPSQYQLLLVASIQGAHHDTPLAETGAFTLEHQSTSTKRARKWMDLVLKQARNWGLEPVEQRAPTHWYHHAFRVSEDLATVSKCQTLG